MGLGQGQRWVPRSKFGCADNILGLSDRQFHQARLVEKTCTLSTTTGGTSGAVEYVSAVVSLAEKLYYLGIGTKFRQHEVATVEKACKLT